MGRGRGKGKKLTAVTSHDDPGSGGEEILPAHKRRGRPQKPLKDDIDEEEIDEKMENIDIENEKSANLNKDRKPAEAQIGKKRRRPPITENPVSIKEENGISTDNIKTNGFRQNGSRRKSKPRRAAEAGVDCKFHLLSEFDQGKRSCRRRLAGHNERRRKPQPGSIFSPRYGRALPSFQENSTRGGGFLMDFTAYPRLSGRDAWPTVKAANWADGNQPSPIKKLLPHQWQGNSENPPGIVYSQASHPYLQGVASGTIFSSTSLPSAECFAGVSDSSCALSLLSNQPWDPRNQTSDLEVNNIMNGEGVSMERSTSPHSAVVTNFTSNTWSFKGNREVSGGFHEIPRQVSHPVTNHFSSELNLAQQGNRQYMEIRHSRDFGCSTHQMHWSL